MNYIEEQMIALKADGVDFIPFSVAYCEGRYWECNIIDSWTIAEAANKTYIPKTPRLFWRIKDGKKYYIKENIK